MARFVEFELEDGGVVLVEAPAAEQTGLVKAGRGEEALERAGATFESALGSVRSAANALLRTLKEVDVSPDEIEVTFGLKATGEVGGRIFVSAGAEANYNVTLTWKKPEAEE